MPQLLSLLFIVICISFLSLNALAQSRWKLAAVDANGKPFYIDENLARQPNGNILGWQRSDLPINNNLYPAGSYFVARYEWDCRDKTHRRLEFLIYDRFDGFIERLDDDTGWKNNPPDSIGEITLNYVCSASKKKSNESSRLTSSADSLAEIIVKNANLMSDARPNSKVIRKISFGEKLVLVSEESVGVWYRVIDSKTGSQGWINGNHFKIVKTVKPVKSGRKIKRGERK